MKTEMFPRWIMTSCMVNRLTSAAVPVIALMALAVNVLAAGPSDGISLDGEWRFQLDGGDVGMKEGWEGRTLPGRIRLPGSLPAQGLGDEVRIDNKWIGTIVDRSFFEAPEYARYRRPLNFKVPFWLQPDRHYAGAAWYQRDVEIPDQWRNKRIVLRLERPHWETRVWVDGRFVGSNTSLATPHEYDLGTSVAPGKHTLTIRVDNRMVIDIGENSHSISDHTQGNWNGIVGQIRLDATPLVRLDDLQVHAETAQSILVKGLIGNNSGESGQGVVTLTVAPASGQGSESLAQIKVNVTWQAQGGEFQSYIPLGRQARAWDEFSPVLYRITATLMNSKDAAAHSESVTFGLREISTEGTQFVINGRKLFIRGTLDCAGYPLTGYPPLEVESWKRVIRIAKAHGLNSIRFHSWCPPEAAFIAADELGFYFQVECSSWPNTGTCGLGDGKPVDRWIYEEADRILKAYGNHPSFLMMVSSNEPGGDHYEDFLKKWVGHYRAKDPRRFYSSGSGGPEVPENHFHVIAEPRIQGWGQGLASRINSRPPETRTDYRESIKQRTVPVVSHEIGQWCVYPNFEEIRKYTGYLKPKNFEIFRDRLVANGMGDLAKSFFLASGKLQTICYKEEIESALRTPGMGGFQLLDLHDFPGQGTALIGVLDAFWDSKGYVTPAEFARFCGPTVPLARLSRRVFTLDENLEADIEFANFGPNRLKRVSMDWKLVSEAGQAVAGGQLPARDVPVDNGVQVGKLSVPLRDLTAPARYRLVVSGAGLENDWDIWVYPGSVETTVPSDVRVVTELNDQTVGALEQGAKVLLLVPPSKVAPDRKLGKTEMGFSTIFWNTAWSNRQPPHTLGILCDPQHPALASFPTEYHSNWQWWYLVSRAGAMILNGLPKELRPTVQVIDDWFTARRLGLLLEARIGKGRLMICSIDLQNNLEANPVARQFRHSLLAYMKSDKFNPQIPVTVNQVRGLMTK